MESRGARNVSRRRRTFEVDAAELSVVPPTTEHRPPRRRTGRGHARWARRAGSIVWSFGSRPPAGQTPDLTARPPRQRGHGEDDGPVRARVCLDTLRMRPETIPLVRIPALKRVKKPLRYHSTSRPLGDRWIHPENLSDDAG